MTFDYSRMLESKRAYRERLEALPLGEKFRILDALREREVAIRSGVVRPASPADAAHEPRQPYKAKSE